MRIQLSILLSVAGLLLAEDAPFEALPISPVLSKLENTVRSGDRGPIERFWAEAARRTTPIIEPVANDPGHVIVSFVWRGDASTKVVLFVAQLVRTRDPGERLMTLLPGTDVWYKAFRIRSDLRLTYGFVPGQSPAALRALGARKLDPLNSRSLMAEPDPENPDATQLGGSILELPKAPPQPWIDPRPGVAAGKLEMQRLRSKSLKNERRIWVYLPAAYDRNAKPYPLLLCFDGYGYVAPGTVPARVILDNLIAAGRIPPLIAIFIDNPWKDRNTELTNHKPFVDFLADELLQWARKQWKITSDPKQTVVNGVSAGGLTSSYVAFRRPDLFGNVLSQSGAYWRANEGADEPDEWLTEQFQTSRVLPIRFVLQVGAVEVTPSPGNGPSLGAANRHLRDVLLAKGYDVQFTEEPGAHEFASWRNGLAEGLIRLIGKNQ